MLRLQRGAPVIYLNTADARRRGVADGDEVEVRNDIDSFRIQARVLPSVRPGQVIVYHAWENYQFKDGKLFQNCATTEHGAHILGHYYRRGAETFLGSSLRLCVSAVSCSLCSVAVHFFEKGGFLSFPNILKGPNPGPSKNSIMNQENPAISNP